LTDEVRSQIQRTVRGKVLFNEPMALHTSLKVGGPADCFAIPADEDDLLNLCTLLSRWGIPCLVVGGGYNLLVRDGGFKGVAISLEDFSHLEYTCSNCIRAGAGVDNRILSAFATESGLGGLEFLTGIPGKLGGALAMNAGAGGHAIMDRVEEIVSLVHGAITKKRKDQCEFGYRFLKLDPGEIVLGALFRLESEEKSLISQRVEAFLAHRKSTQQVGFPNAGSFFKNPPEKPAWRLIDEAGFRGYRMGGAQVSEVHTNFLVNRGGAKASDFLRLGELIKSRVREMTGITLEEEVKISGTD